MDRATRRPGRPASPASASEPDSDSASDTLATNDLLALSIAILRIVRRWSQSDLAQASGLVNSAISDYERGKVDPQTRSLLRLLDAMGYPLSVLDQTRDFILLLRAQMGGSDSPPVTPDASDPASTRQRSRKRDIALIAAQGAQFTAQFVHLLFEVLDDRPGES
jgi:transcriptional regulator with XRE-family HTH domain